MNDAQLRDAQVQEGSAVSGREASASPAATQPEVSGPAVVPAQCPNCKAPMALTQPAPQAFTNQFVYAIGDVDAVYPNLGVEKYALTRMVGANFRNLSKSDVQQLALERNPDLARLVCYVMLVQEVETYILVPRFPDIGYLSLVEAAKTELSAVIGTLGPIANPDLCNGLTLPILIFDSIFNFSKQELINGIPVPEGLNQDAFRAAANDLWDVVLPAAGVGTGANRAIVQVLANDQTFWALALSQQLRSNAELKSIDVQPVAATARTLVDVRATFTYRDNWTEKTYCRTFDLTNKFVVGLGQQWRLCTGGTAP